MKCLSTNVEARVILWVSLKAPGGGGGVLWLSWWLQTGTLIGQMTKQHLMQIKQLSDCFLKCLNKILHQSITGYDLI